MGLFSVRRLFGGGGLSVPPVGVGAFFAAVCGGLRRFGSKFVLNRPWGVTAGDGARFVDSPGHRVLCCDTAPGSKQALVVALNKVNTININAERHHFCQAGSKSQ